MQAEPVSPELVLVDPELARRERARLEERALLLDIAALRRAVESEPAPVEETVRGRPYWREVGAFSRGRILPAALLCSLLANGFFAAELVARQDGRDSATPVAVRMVTLTDQASEAVSTSFPLSTSPAAATTPSQRRSRVALTKAAVEREVISVIVTAATRRLPRRFVDANTGLVKNNVQVVCRRRQTRSFLCAVRLATDKPKAAIYVRYRADRRGKGIFRWSGNRRG